MAIAPQYYPGNKIFTPLVRKYIGEGGEGPFFEVRGKNHIGVTTRQEGELTVFYVEDDFGSLFGGEAVTAKVFKGVYQQPYVPLSVITQQQGVTENLQDKTFVFAAGTGSFYYIAIPENLSPSFFINGFQVSLNQEKIKVGNENYVLYISPVANTGEVRVSVTVTVMGSGGGVVVDPPPALPLRIRIDGVGATSAAIRLTSVYEAQYYQITYAEDIELKEEVRTIETTSTELTLTDLKENQTYYILYRYFKNDNASVYSSVLSFATTFAVPLVPSGVSLTANAAGKYVDISWNIDSFYTGFVIEYAIGADEEVNYTPIVRSDLQAADTTFRHTGLQPNTLYYYRIKTINGEKESAYSQAVSTSFQQVYFTVFDFPLGAIFNN